MKNFKLVWSARSECGPNRKKNEDSIYPSTSGNNQPPFKAAVCDGLGGHVSGDIASKIAADTLNEKVEEEHQQSKIDALGVKPDNKQVGRPTVPKQKLNKFVNGQTRV